MCNTLLTINHQPLNTPPGYIIVEKNEVRLGPKIEEHDYADLVKKHWALLLVVLISALVVTLTPIIG